MSDVQLPPTAHALTAPRGTHVADRNSLEIHLGRTDELREALAAAASIGITAMTFDFCFYEDGDATCETSPRRTARGRKADKQDVDAAFNRVRDLVEDAIREALEAEFELDREIRVGVGFEFDAERSSWGLSGSATAYDIVPDLNDVEVGFA
jgi:hypothetical protein